ncbi:nuclear factor of activated T-cells, cytoplasmic 3 [Xyrauchen texanus]|uniref:nuclear factor of activated T-cells, cytoplasmic 3 n=1 Tax=Xyrauchen texanus TaxID=154827 RepID=UPI0022426EC6|nr:nuclear factor of activated T-cells, cytoplasmic 3 [Xyrauchen texanus]
MTTANCPGNEELDFRLIFGEDGQQPQLGPADLEQDDSTSFYIFNVGQPPSVVNQSHGLQRHGGPHSAQLIATSSSLQAHHKAYEPSYKPQDSKYTPTGVGVGASGPPKAFECPSIQITSISPSCQQEMEASENEMRGKGPEGEYHERPLSRDHLYLPLDHSYRDSSLSPSPCSSLSSRSWFSDASSCESISHVYDDVDSELNEAAARFTLGSPLTSTGCSTQAGPQEELWQQQQQQHHHPAFTHSHSHAHAHSLSPCQSPCHSPRTSITDENWLSPRSPSRPSSRPTSPCGKRRHSSADICYLGSLSPHHSPTATPGPSPRGSVTEETWIGSPSMGVSPFQCCPSEADIPSKTRKTSQDCTAAIQPGNGDLGMDDSGNISPLIDSPAEDGMHSLKKDGSGDQFLSVPSHFTWNKPKPGHTPIFRASSLPPLDWPLPSQYGQLELKIEVHPKAHHRAHYETEGSRGAVKASSGGHPIVKLIGYNEKPVNLQMFIGTADDRYLRPHAFYQIHRITGKTVATASQEIIITSTKVLEIPLLPENNMTASIDCAGILKLRNSDIELRKGETDIGRKNTRVRVVFRVHIPQPNGKVVTLQAASIPVECSQRSAQELPQVEKASISSCPVSGGEEMVISGSNFFPESKVIFLEKGPDGRPQWEVEARIQREKSQGSSIVVEVPPYHSKTVTSAVQVQFYVCNGKRKRSQSQRFTYLPVLVKQEHRDELDSPAMPPMSMPLVHAASLVCAQPLSSPEHSHPPDGLLSSSPRGLAAGLHPLQAPCAPMGSPTLPHLPHLQALGLNASPECQMPFHPDPAATARPSYPHLQHNMHFNGQHSLPMTADSSQAYERIPFQADPAGCNTLGLGMVYGPASSTPTSGGAGGPASSPSHAACTSSSQIMAHSTPHLHSLGYHCSTPGQVPSPTHMLGQPAPQLQHPLVYHAAGQQSTSCPTPSRSPARMVQSPHSGPSSPQLHSLPYHSPTSPSPTSNSPLGPLALSGQPSSQASSPVFSALSPAGSMVHPLTQQGDGINIKQEPEDREPTFRTIGLQDITLDDVNEIIGRDMSQAPVAHGGSPAAHSQS